MMRTRLLLSGLCIAALLARAPASAQKAQDTLRVAWRDAVPNVDPYYNSLRTGLVVAHQAWDTLIYRDPETFTLKPLLATSWRYADDTTIEFELRAGVKFHDGSPFTADDVVYTVQSALSDKQVAVPSNFSFIAGAEKIDDLHVRIKLKRVFPAALEYIAMVLPIYPKDYRERVGAEYSKAPVGTGPYRITKVDGASEIDMESNDDYFDSPITHIAFTPASPPFAAWSSRRWRTRPASCRRSWATRPTGSGCSARTRSTTSIACRRCRRSAARA